MTVQKFKKRNLKAVAQCIIGDNEAFEYLSSSYITEFFEDCDLEYRHDGSTRWAWTTDVLNELLSKPTSGPHELPPVFVHVLRVLMDPSEAKEDDPDRSIAVAELNKPLLREGFEGFYDEQGHFFIRHVGSKRLSMPIMPTRPLTREEVKKREALAEYLDGCSEDDMTEEVLLPMFRQLGFSRISIAGHRDKALEYGKDLWLRFTLPTQHVLYFGIQVKRGKLDAAGQSKGSNRNIAEIHNQALMMLGHKIFDSDASREVLVDHAFIIAGGTITKAARNWLGGKLDAAKRSQIMFMDREDILNLFVTNNVPLPPDVEAAMAKSAWDEIPF